MRERTRLIFAQILFYLAGFFWLFMMLNSLFWQIGFQAWKPTGQERGILAVVFSVLSGLCFWIFAGERRQWFEFKQGRRSK